jgi:hypothetical protein
MKQTRVIRAAVGLAAAASLLVLTGCIYYSGPYCGSYAYGGPYYYGYPCGGPCYGYPYRACYAGPWISVHGSYGYYGGHGGGGHGHH